MGLLRSTTASVCSFLHLGLGVSSSITRSVAEPDSTGRSSSPKRRVADLTFGAARCAWDSPIPTKRGRARTAYANASLAVGKSRHSREPQAWRAGSDSGACAALPGVTGGAALGGAAGAVVLAEGEDGLGLLDEVMFGDDAQPRSAKA